MRKLGVDVNSMAVIPISAWLGDNLIEPSANMPWFKRWSMKTNGSDITGPNIPFPTQFSGVTLIDAINALEAPKRAANTPLRIPILTCHNIAGVGTVAVGRVASGTLKRGQEVATYPPGIQVAQSQFQ